MAGTAVLAKGGSQQVPPCAGQCLCSIQQTDSDSRQHLGHTAVKTPPACAWSALWQSYGSLAVHCLRLSLLNILDSGVCLTPSGCAMLTSSISANSHFSTWLNYKNQEAQHQLEPFKSQLKKSLEHNNESTAQGTCRAGTIGFTEGC